MLSGGCGVQLFKLHVGNINISSICFYVCFLFCVLYVFVMFCILFLPMYRTVYFLFMYNFTDHCHRAETQLQLIRIS